MVELRNEEESFATNRELCDGLLHNGSWRFVSKDGEVLCFGINKVAIWVKGWRASSIATKKKNVSSFRCFGNRNQIFLLPGFHSTCHLLSL